MNSECANFTFFPLLSDERICTDLHGLSSFLGMENCSKKDSIIHVTVPFCDSICSFCNARRFLRTDEALKTYLGALRAEMKRYSEMNYVKSSDFSALYLHGGTPTTLSSEELRELIQNCRSSFNFNADMELTVESTTHNLDADKINGLLDSGLSRLYIGVQTFDDTIRKKLNRTNSSSAVAETIIQAKKLGCKAIRADLMYNLPGQDMRSWKRDLLKAVELGIDNVSIFRFHLYPNLSMARGIESGEIPSLPRSITVDEMYNVALDTFKDAGYQQQYSSGFTLSGKKSKYFDLFYKYQHDGLGLGITNWFFSLLGRYSFRNTDDLGAYAESIRMGGLPISTSKCLSDYQLMQRFISKGLNSAVDKTIFLKRFGVAPGDYFQNQLHELEKDGLIIQDEWEIRATPTGMKNRCWELFS